MPLANQQQVPTVHPLTANDLSAIAEGIAAGDPAAFVPAGTDRRWGIVIATEAYEAWVIAWPSGTGLAMHDHGNLHEVEAISVHVYSPPVGDMGFRVDPEIDLRTSS